MLTTDTLRAEHEATVHVLAQLEQAANAAAVGTPVPADVFQDIQEFLTIFVDQCHHGKEEGVVFPQLQRDNATLIERLEAEHTTGRALSRAFTHALQVYQPGNTASGATLAAAAHAYAAFLRAHIDQETQELFPAIERTLAPEDAQMVDAFERIEVERIGPGTHERLHHMIDSLPARIAPFLTADQHR